MSRKKGLLTKLVVYLGGPTARPGDFGWLYRNGRWVDPTGNAAYRAGVEIPRDTYEDADPRTSAQVMLYWRPWGKNTTAFLPLEVDA